MNKFFTFILAMILISCSSEKQLKDTKNSIRLTKLDVWLNLMPGGKPTFHYSGEIEIEDYISSIIEFENIYIYSDKRLIHSSQPISELLRIDENKNSSDAVINFYSPKNIEVTKNLIRTKIVDIILILKYGSKQKKIIKNNIQLQKAY
jgi:hypothetical protein